MYLHSLYLFFFIITLKQIKAQSLFNNFFQKNFENQFLIIVFKNYSPKHR